MSSREPLPHWLIQSQRDDADRSCGMVWRPAIVPTVGVRFLPGFKNATT